MPELPSAAWSHVPDVVRDSVTPLTFTVLYYGIGAEDVGFFGEVSEKTWIERTAGATYTYKELVENPNRVVLYDEVRDRTVTINWSNYHFTISDDGVQTSYIVTDSEDSLRPFVPPDSWF
ncbi:hypothetical protein OMW55_10225 [Sphingomonas sp. BN140010]|uniref:Uncharacterized protein n=1 Tax=Sphingomonas arvum TaxID=2992113 RepID=A0ABT3JGG8_9SPHN|nr:hypothetical protein [Sphingomonas sp. BN140010]MCW3798180.1 hypothetical protein [Sphingomonas sp. BN140010]